eukprot:gene12873-15119_t
MKHILTRMLTQRASQIDQLLSHQKLFEAVSTLRNEEQRNPSVTG